MEQMPLPQVQVQPQAQQPQYFQFILLLAFLIGLLYLIVYGLGIANVSANWAENRCKPQILPFASLYGYNTADNFNYCMKNVISDQAGQSLGPIYQILASFVGTLSTLLASANSLRLSLATMVGGITKVFQEFSERINALMTRVRISTVRMKMLFGRLFATFYAMIYMGMSGITAVTNFGDTFLFKFLDTFCFDPDTQVEVFRGGIGAPLTIPVRAVKIDDIFTKTGSKVTATFSFIADGQPMVYLGNTLVSTNHYVKSPTGNYVRAADHPDSISAGPWIGGTERPLICFNTSDHHIPIGDHLFLDYDETDAANESTMNRLQTQVNGGVPETTPIVMPSEYSPGVHENTSINIGYPGINKLAKDIKLNKKISVGKVIGIVKKRVDNFICINEEILSETSLIWDNSTNSWKRGSQLLATGKAKKANLEAYDKFAYSFIVSPSATIETRQGTCLRDYMEVMSPDAENDYTKQIASQVS